MHSTSLGVARPSRRTLAFITGLLATLALAVTADRALAISSDYCGQYLSNGQQCYEGSGYQYWRYHQASTGGIVTLPYLCAQSWTGSNYRTGSQCWANTDFYSFCNASDWPAGNSSVNFGGVGGGNTYRVWGHADNSTSHSRITSNNGC